MLATRIAEPSTMTSVVSLSVHWEFHNGILACGSQEIVLGPMEGRLLSTLMDAKGRVMTHGSIIESLYGRDEPADPRTELRYAVFRLRKKIAATSLKVTTLKGWGYRLTNADTTAGQRSDPMVEGAVR